MNIAAIIISIASSIVSGLVIYFLKKYFDKKEAKDNKKEELKRKENILILKSIDAIGKLTYANSIAVRDGKTNGELKEGLKAYNDVKKDMYDYLLEQNSIN